MENINKGLMFIQIFKSLAFLALQRETIVKKIMQLKLPKTKNKVAKICNDPGIRDFTNLNVT